MMVQLPAGRGEGLSHLCVLERRMRPGAGNCFSSQQEKCFWCNWVTLHLCFAKIIIKLHDLTLPQVEDKKKRRRPRRSQSERRVRNRTLTERDVKHLERHLSMKRTIRWNKEVLTSRYGRKKTEKTDFITSFLVNIKVLSDDNFDFHAQEEDHGRPPTRFR